METTNFEVLKIDGTLRSISRPEDIVYRREARDCLKRAFKRFCEEADLEEVEYCKVNDIKEITISDTAKIILTTKKKEKFHTEEIYDLFGFTPVQRSVLEKNPGFRKKELEKSLGNKDEVKNLVDCEWSDVLELKVLDERFIK